MGGVFTVGSTWLGQNGENSPKPQSPNNGPIPPSSGSETLVNISHKHPIERCLYWNSGLPLPKWTGNEHWLGYIQMLNPSQTRRTLSSIPPKTYSFHPSHTPIILSDFVADAVADLWQIPPCTGLQDPRWVVSRGVGNPAAWGCRHLQPWLQIDDIYFKWDM